MKNIRKRLLKNLKPLLNLSHEAMDTDSEGEDPSFELNSSLKPDTHHLLDTFCEEWVAQLSREDTFLLDIFLQYQISAVPQQAETESAELAALMIGKSDRTICEWKLQFLENNGRLQRVNKAITSILVFFGKMNI